MRSLWASMAVIGLMAGTAAAETRYDRNIEQAAIEIVAGKIGDIRGGFSFDARPALVTGKDAIRTGSIPTPSVTVVADPWQDGLAPAVDRKGMPVLF
jgi:hypothetical protein